MLFRAPQPHTRGYRASSGGSGTVVAKKNVGFVDGFRFNGQDPVSRRGKATGRGAFQVQSAQAIRAAYYFDLAARDYILADGAIEPVIERVPCSAFIEPSQSSELIFYGQSDRLRGRKHAADCGKFRRDLARLFSHMIRCPNRESLCLSAGDLCKPTFGWRQLVVQVC